MGNRNYGALFKYYNKRFYESVQSEIYVDKTGVISLLNRMIVYSNEL